MFGFNFNNNTQKYQHPCLVWQPSQASGSDRDPARHRRPYIVCIDGNKAGDGAYVRPDWAETPRGRPWRVLSTQPVCKVDATFGPTHLIDLVFGSAKDIEEGNVPEGTRLIDLVLERVRDGPGALTAAASSGNSLGESTGTGTEDWGDDGLDDEESDDGRREIIYALVESSFEHSIWDPDETPGSSCSVL